MRKLGATLAHLLRSADAGKALTKTALELSDAERQGAPIEKLKRRHSTGDGENIEREEDQSESARHNI